MVVIEGCWVVVEVCCCCCAAVDKVGLTVEVVGSGEASSSPEESSEPEPESESESESESASESPDSDSPAAFMRLPLPPAAPPTVSSSVSSWSSSPWSLSDSDELPFVLASIAMPAVVVVV